MHPSGNDDCGSKDSGVFECRESGSQEILIDEAYTQPDPARRLVVYTRREYPHHGETRPTEAMGEAIVNQTSNWNAWEMDGETRRSHARLL